MNRTTLLQERRMQTFHDVLGHWQARRLSALEAAELLGMSERSFHRYRQRYEEEGLDGLFDRRLGKASARRVPADQVAWVLDEYRTHYRGWTVKHFHDRLRDRHGFAWSYTWTKTTLQRAGLVPKAPRRGVHRRRRERKPCVGMMLHQDGSRHEWLAGQAPLDLIVTMDDATSEIYSAFLVEEEGTASTFRALKQVFTAKGLPSSLYTDRGSHYFHTPRGRRQSGQEQPDPGRPRPPPAQHRTHRRLLAPGRAAAPSAPSEPSRTAWSRNSASPASPRSRPQTASSKRATCPTTTGASQQSPSSKPAPSCHRLHPTRSTRSCACTQSAWSRTTTPCATKDGSCKSPPARPGPTTSRPRSGCTSIQTAHSPSSTDPDASPAIRQTASPSTHQSGRPREPLRRSLPAPCGQVDSRSAPDHFPTGPTATTEADNRCATETGQIHLLATPRPAAARSAVASLAHTVLVAWIGRAVASLLGRAGQPQSAGSGGCRAAPS